MKDSSFFSKRKSNIRFSIHHKKTIFNVDNENSVNSIRRSLQSIQLDRVYS